MTPPVRFTVLDRMRLVMRLILKPVPHSLGARRLDGILDSTPQLLSFRAT